MIKNETKWKTRGLGVIPGYSDFFNFIKRRVIDRKNTGCLKYDFAERRGMPSDVLPLWVADMDFATSSYVEDALVERAREGIFGYSEVQTPYFEAVHDWMKRHHNWDIEERWLIKTPGVVFALVMAVKAYTMWGIKC